MNRGEIMLTIIIIILSEIFVLWAVINCIKLDINLINVLIKGERLDGVICGFNVFEGSHRNCYVPLIKFKYKDDEIQAQSILALRLRLKHIRVGSNVSIKYNPDYPGMVVMENKKRTIAVLLINTAIIIVGLLFFICSIIYIMFSIYVVS